MQRFNEEEQDVYFDSYDYCRASTSSASSGESIEENQGSVLRKFEQEFWARELISVGERRARFLRGMGLDEFMSPGFQEPEEATSDESAEKLVLERITEASGAVLDSLSQDSGHQRESDCCIRDLDSGKRFIVQGLGQDGLFSMLREVGSDRLMTLQEFESSLGLSRSVQRFMRSAAASSEEENRKGLNAQKNKSRSWWRSFMAKRHGIGIGMCKDDDAVRNSRLPRTRRTRVQQHGKRCLEFTALYMGQEIQAHKGLIRVMKFCQSGCLLASGGEDCVARIWKVIEVETSCKCFTTETSCKFDKIRDKKLMLGRKARKFAPVVIPKKVFKIEETPLQELRGHTSDVLDLSWSNADCLLTSSKDKTVRLWKVGFNQCLQVFQHNNYVTCIQFNPVDNRYFISGSIDGKVRIWCVSENRVVHWAALRDIITAVCYRPDGNGFVVGSITGNCRFYDVSDNNMQLGTQFCIQGRKKSAGKRITGLQFSPEDSERIMITSTDSKVRIFDGADVINKFRGLRKTKSHRSASFTSDGRYIVSVGEDSHIYIWNYNTSGSSPSKGSVKSSRSCERFFSEGVSVAVPWPGMDRSGLGSSNSHFDPPTTPLKILEPSTWLKDLDRCYFNALFLVDGLSRGSATWPEEELIPSSPELNHHRQLDYRFPCLTSLSATWSLVIVTASSDGLIRSFHNYGLPVRL